MKDFQLVFTIFSLWLICMLGVLFFGVQFIFPSLTNSFFSLFSHWDGQHYLGIAQFGYFKSQEYAFFPFYPMLISLFQKLIGSYLLSGLFINLVCSFLGMLFFYKLVCIEINKRSGFIALLSLLFFPTSFYFLMIYSEALFFLLSILSFYFLKKKRFLLAVIFSGLASFTRPLGIVVAFAIIFQLIRLKQLHEVLFSWIELIRFAFISIFGLVLYMIYLFFISGSPFSFMIAQTNWNRSLAWPWESVLLSILNLVSSTEFLMGQLVLLWELTFLIFGVGLILRSFRFLSTHIALYGLFSVLVPLVTYSLMSIPRFLLPIFPIFMVIALTKNKYVLYGYFILSGFLLIFFSTLFINGFWVS